MLSMVLAVVVLPLLFQIELSPCTCLSVNMQIYEAVPTGALAGILQGGITVRSIIKLESDTAYVQGLQVFEPSEREEGLRNPSKL